MHHAVQPLPDKTGPVTADGLLDIVREVRIAADPAVQLQVHIHSDKDKSIIEGAVQKLIQDNGWGQTTTVGYDHNANPRIERRWQKIQRIFRAMLMTATKARGAFKQLWSYGYKHANRVANNSPEAGTLSPLEKLNPKAKPHDFAAQPRVFGALVRAYVPVEKRADKFDPVTVLGVHAGQSDACQGGAPSVSNRVEQGTVALGHTASNHC